MAATARRTSGRVSAARGRRTVPAGTGSEGAGALSRAADCDVAEQALRALHTELLRHRIREALAALPDHQRRTVRLRLFEGWADAEIAPVLGVTPQQVAGLWRAGFAAVWSALRADPGLWLDGGPGDLPSGAPGDETGGAEGEGCRDRQQNGVGGYMRGQHDEGGRGEA